MQNGATMLENKFSASKNVKQRPSNFPPRGNENMYLYKHLYMSIHSSTMNNNHNVETTRVSLGRDFRGIRRSGSGAFTAWPGSVWGPQSTSHVALSPAKD